MDTHDPGPKYWEVIKKQWEALEEGKKRKGQRPQDRKSREYAKVMFMIACMNTAPCNTGYVIHTSFIPLQYPPCIKPMADLKQTTMQDLQLETHHRGAYVLLRCITPPRRKTAILVLTEDKNDDVAMLQIYQQEDEEVRPATDIANTGTVLLIKEPFYKVLENGEYGFRVDHISDIVQLKNNDVRIPLGWQLPATEVEQSAESLKLKGNLAMKEGRFWDAINIYSDALAQPVAATEADILKRNRSLAFLRTKQFDAALSDTGFPNFGENASEKAMFRAGEALYNLRRFDECFQVLDRLCHLYPLHDLARASLDRVKTRLREQKIGDYNFKRLQAEAQMARPPLLDHATYIGPVAIRQTASKGRGLFVTKAMKAGDLILCEKAFAYCYAPEEEPGIKKGSGPVINIFTNYETNSTIIGTQADLIKTVAQKLHHNPSLSPGVTALYHGDYKTTNTTVVDDMQVVDSFLIERIVCLNMFVCPDSSLKFHSDLYRHHIMPKNGFTSSGLWVQASYINHSCTNNAQWAIIGDMMIVRATCDLEAETEILLCYETPIEKTREVFQQKLWRWGIRCECAICSDDLSTAPAVLKRRDKLRSIILEEVFEIKSPGGDEARKVELLLGELNQTYAQPALKVPRLLVWDLQYHLANKYACQNNMGKCIATAGKILRSLGFLITDTMTPKVLFAVRRWGMTTDLLVPVFLLFRYAFDKKNDWANTNRAMEYAIIAFKMVVGEDASFDSVWVEE